MADAPQPSDLERAAAAIVERLKAEGLPSPFPKEGVPPKSQEAAQEVVERFARIYEAGVQEAAASS